MLQSLKSLRSRQLLQALSGRHLTTFASPASNSSSRSLSSSPSFSSSSSNSSSSSSSSSYSPHFLSFFLSAASLTLLSTKLIHADSGEKGSQAPKSSSSLSSAYERFKEKRKGHYENRIRAFSHPQKIFQYFSSIRKNGECFMTPLDFIDSILPYHPLTPEEEEEEALKGGGWEKEKERRFQEKCESAIEFFKLADMDGDGLISFDEYVFFLTLMSTPESHFRIAFKVLDADGSGSIDLKEFQRVIVQSNSGVNARQGRRQRIQVGQNLKHGLLKHLFGEAGNKQIDFNAFRSFLLRLQEEVLRLEFYSYQVDENDTLSLKDFARAVVSYAHHNEVSDFAKRIERLPEYSKRITFENFVAFHSIIQDMDKISYAIDLYAEVEHLPGTIVSREDLKRAIQASVGVEIHDEVADMLFRVFDRNQDGILDSSEFVHILKARHLRGLDQPKDLGFSQFFEKVLSCSKLLFR